MDAVEIRQEGRSSVLHPTRRPVPEPGEGEVLIRVRAAGVNRPDVLQRLGHHPPPPGASDLPGLEVSGTVVACGGGARTTPGTPVCALLAGGGYAQYATAPEVQCLPVPGPLSPFEAASLPETFFTVWDNVFTRARLKAGETLLVHGGSSGIGTTAIQLGLAFGARVAATAGSEEKCAALLALGAGRAIAYKSEDFVAAVRAFTGGKGADVILDIVGGAYFQQNLDALATDGRLVVIGLMGGDSAPALLGTIMRKRLTVLGSTLRSRTVAEKGAIAERLRESVWPLLEAGRVRPLLYKVLPLAAAAEAHALMESSRHIGKIVLDVP
jgi:NADPH2:quinone reductase